MRSCVRTQVLPAMRPIASRPEGSDRQRAETSAQDFIKHDLIERLGISGIAVGYDFHFGKGRVGSPGLLVSEGPRLGIEVDVQPHVDIDERPVSSSAIRDALAEGQI